MSAEKFANKRQSTVPLAWKAQLSSDLRYFISQLFETCLACCSYQPIKIFLDLALIQSASDGSAAARREHVLDKKSCVGGSINFSIAELNV
jgi:hypothetical protein